MKYLGRFTLIKRKKFQIMGFDIARFEGEVDQDLICPICSAVLEEPLQVPQCEHKFCKNCINKWLSTDISCPVDRQPIISSLTQTPQTVRNLLSCLKIICEHSPLGCTVIVNLDCLSMHQSNCKFNPKTQIPCERGCGMVIRRDEQKDHDCIKDLRSLLQSQLQKIAELGQEVLVLKDDNKSLLESQQQKITALQSQISDQEKKLLAIEDQLENANYVCATATIRHVVRNFSVFRGKSFSRPIRLQKLLWKISVEVSDLYLGIFLSCNENDDSKTWACHAQAQLKLINQKSGGKDVIKQFNHTFCSVNNNWGWKYFMDMKDVLNPKEDFVKMDTIILEVFVQAEPPGTPMLKQISNVLYNEGIIAKEKLGEWNTY